VDHGYAWITKGDCLMAPSLFFSIIIFITILTLVYKIDNFIKMGIPFLLIGLTFITESVNQSESFFITIFFILQIFLSLSLPEKIDSKIKALRILPVGILILSIYSMVIYLDIKKTELANSITSYVENTLKAEGDIYIILLLMVSVLFSSINTKRNRKWN
jgi:hypothetical protein